MFSLVFLFFLHVVRFVSTFQCQLYAIDQSSPNVEFIQIDNDGSSSKLVNLGHSVFTATVGSVNINNQSITGTCHTYDQKGIPHFFLLTINPKTKSVVSNVSLVEIRDSGSFYQIASVNEDEIVGIRDSLISPMGLEVAKIYPSTGIMETIGIYPTGKFSIVMTYASKRRVYYNVVDSTLFGLNIDTGKMDVHIRMNNTYVYGLDYDEKTDRLIAIIYDIQGAQHSWIMTEVVINSRQHIEFRRIGNATIDFDKYLWTTTYTMNSAERLWISSWDDRDKYTSTLLFFNLDTGDIVQTLHTKLKDLSNLVCLNQ